MLEGDPVKRIQWVYLRKHVFWKEPLSGVKLARDFEFENYLKFKRGINPGDFYELSKGAEFIVNSIRFSYPDYEGVKASKSDKLAMLRIAKGFNEISVPYTDDQRNQMDEILATKMEE